MSCPANSRKGAGRRPTHHPLLPAGFASDPLTASCSATRKCALSAATCHPAADQMVSQAAPPVQGGDSEPSCAVRAALLWLSKPVGASWCTSRCGRDAANVHALQRAGAALPAKTLALATQSPCGS